MIAIHKGIGGFHPFWIDYCEDNHVSYKLVDCYSNDIVNQLEGCNALLWHHTQSDPKDINIAKNILFAAEQSGILVFPNFNSNWHFDDKVAQKYLFEFFKINAVRSYVFVREKDALEWAKVTSFPKVFKLRGGAGSNNVKLISDKREAFDVIKKAFSKGFRPFNSIEYFSDHFKKWLKRKTSFNNLLKSIYRLFYKPDFEKALGNEFGYIYFQDFIPNNSFDIRTIVIGDKAFAIKRYVRENDFRASGSGIIEYEKHNFDDSLIQLSFSVSELLKTQCLAFDFVFSRGEPLLVEISYGFLPDGYKKCRGYWDKQLNWYDGKFNPYGWMVESILHEK